MVQIVFIIRGRQMAGASDLWPGAHSSWPVSIREQGMGTQGKRGRGGGELQPVRSHKSQKLLRPWTLWHVIFK
jgi:hypothetical protein